jgi:hypothetical protein
MKLKNVLEANQKFLLPNRTDRGHIFQFAHWNWPSQLQAQFELDRSERVLRLHNYFKPLSFAIDRDHSNH